MVKSKLLTDNNEPTYQFLIYLFSLVFYYYHHNYYLVSESTAEVTSSTFKPIQIIVMNTHMMTSCGEIWHYKKNYIQG